MKKKFSQIMILAVMMIAVIGISVRNEPREEYEYEAEETADLLSEEIEPENDAGLLPENESVNVADVLNEGAPEEQKSRREVFAAIEEGDFSVVAKKDSDPDGIIELLEMAYELDGDTRRMERCDIDGDGFNELLLLVKYDFEDYERIDFVLDYMNGWAVCTYLDWCDGNEWLLLGDEEKLIHCSHSDNGSCDYYGFYECTLSARGIKDIDYTGYGIEVCDVYESGEVGLWWWEGQQPEITQSGIYFTEVRSKDEVQIKGTGTADDWIKELITEEQFLEEYKELTGQDFILHVDLERADIFIADVRGGDYCLGYTDKGWFLKDFGFEGKEPFYQYYDENGELQLELYYNERTGRDCGIRYYPGEQRNPQGFRFGVSSKELCDPEVLQEGLLSENCYITHGSMDYYYIYQGEETMPSYCLVLDHDLGIIHAGFVSIHEVVADEDGKLYGSVKPDISENNFVKAVREAGGYNTNQITHTYEDDYDGDGYYEAFVVIGHYMDMWGEVTEDQISGDLWFVDHDQNASYLQKATFDAWQEYIRQDGKAYLFISHAIGLPWITEIYTVQDNEAVTCAEGAAHRVKRVGANGQVIQTQDAYDGGYNMRAEYGWLGHTWKPYTFEFDHGKLREIGAKEVTLKDVLKIASLPEDFDEKEYDGVQYILRDNGELNINMASYDEEFEYVGFGYFTYYANEDGEWELTDEGPGLYCIQLDGGSRWDYLDKLEEFKHE